MRRDLAPKVVPLTDASTIAISADVADNAIMDVTLGGNRTLGNPSGSPRNGQRFMLRVKQDTTGGRTLSFDSAYRFGALIPIPTLSAIASKLDRLGWEYHAGDGKWDLIAFSKGF